MKYIWKTLIENNLQLQYIYGAIFEQLSVVITKFIKKKTTLKTVIVKNIFFDNELRVVPIMRSA